MKTKSILTVSVLILVIVFLNSCETKRSSTTGWDYNDPESGGFEYVEYYEQETGPGLVLIEGGTFSMGRVEQDVMYDWNNVPRRTTVSSFYMDECEVRNVDYREYLYWLTRVYIDYPEVYKKALPDTLVWRRKLAWNEPMVELYLRHPSYQEYPVVGVNWYQANDYCAWRTDRVNEWILIREGLLLKNPNQVGEDNFNTDAYLAGQYEGLMKSPGIPDYDPNRDYRKVRMEDGILLPRYRLPTEAEWEFAALSLIGNSIEERVFTRKLYPWNGHYVRNDGEQHRGTIMANFMRGRGDMMGTAGALNDNADIPGPVDSYWPNDYGLYCMAGNVSEWVMDVYRPLTFQDAEEFRPFRGNVFVTPEKDEDGNIYEKDSLGHIRWREVGKKDLLGNEHTDEAFDRRNYNQSDNINYLDGDFQSSVNYSQSDKAAKHTSTGMYDQGKTTDGMRGGAGMTSMVNDNARVYKGGSWSDRAYWLVPGTRRYLDEKQRQDDLGFRCAMVRVGSPVGF
ncbi:MAG TPA: gliding motility lipoprotein GldJ [Bacteroidales bacterium]|nr:MAG: gliding motility lipoprotein GldJ [Bacteroidetes bacterium GWF2_33_38]OFY74246.1 MAG: gliding motility lipoprotein GldJ [Bacteroidetes bacterium RIFOXYA12_FULL_33_9]OFY91769.1 MAG: gliding motility lipoprotein GldJ [Bacteroidetes bacterium RIFOXYA2_FULL_33_7]HBF88457.1 gliding motility lipoprotein GldJ [Bacteroidales bacterium]